MTAPVAPRRVAIAGLRLENVTSAARASREAGIPFPAACALLEMESGGRNVYGHDEHGVLSGFEAPVTAQNFAAFEHEVIVAGRTSNGVGPCQITYRGYFPEMKKAGLRPYIPYDNMLFGFRILAANYKRTKSWEKAFAQYNGGPNPNADAQRYGKKADALRKTWKQRFEA